ncbi:MAG: hypothetical protein Q9184_004052 [Pyrenodesmia sp. 2 TL-2023]
MAYNNINQGSGPQNPAFESIHNQSATTDFGAEQPTSTAQEIPSADSKRTQQPPGSKTEDRLEREGHLPGLSDVQNDNEKNVRQPGQEDAAGNKIHHKGILGKMLHWEHNGMNAD